MYSMALRRTRQNRNATSCEVIDAIAAPNTPHLNTMTNSRSSRILSSAAVTMAMNGERPSPNERSIEPARLYAVIITVPASMVDRYITASPRILSGVPRNISRGFAIDMPMTVSVSAITADSTDMVIIARFIFVYSRLPKNLDTNVAKPAAITDILHITIQYVQSVHPTAARASTPTPLPTIAASTIWYNC